ncbi:MAG: hypothetical protein A3A04_01035 [Candidatus Harrisonbacteria bacterium RIFCSPLOWO2_01_FULL_40_28]|uniref:Membrane insertase YidC/Oxa/ALB C-terminal domain-containing protein n=2 Tax=Candidatus Harrisoniibacteriota TaxID=1817905 RepID=A0A1G2A0R6_9BACT|nr:MAG: hypothetical protein A3A04_01035 [Candidatus Harrisonbacteria bacterium RIFCSPLOWO2_01_FULL_40_28]OGY69660.1 MAG: hypothetical protein A2586_01510 [Candidatus Harrisonbacteria bacterium RIFOXYD1_FULL_40_9]
MISSFFYEVFYRPLFNGLIFLYNTAAFHDIGLAIIMLTIFIRIILYPLFHKGARHQAVMQRLQPEIRKIQHDHKEDKEKQAQALLALYKENNINPFSGIFLIFLQLPVLWALFKVFYDGLSPDAFAMLYSFVSRPEVLNLDFLNLINVGEKSILVVGLAAIAQYVQGKLSFTPQLGNKDDAAAKVGSYMVFIAPLFTVIVLVNLPAAVGIYWLTSSLFSVFQQWIINRNLSKEQFLKNNGST